jgi:hypothetical protein
LEHVSQSADVRRFLECSIVLGMCSRAHRIGQRTAVIGGENVANSPDKYFETALALEFAHGEMLVGRQRAVYPRSDLGLRCSRICGRARCSP